MTPYLSPDRLSDSSGAGSNHIPKSTRAEWIAHHDFTPIVPCAEDALLELRSPLCQAGSRIIGVTTHATRCGRLQPVRVFVAALDA